MVDADHIDTGASAPGEESTGPYGQGKAGQGRGTTYMDVVTAGPTAFEVDGGTPGLTGDLTMMYAPDGKREDASPRLASACWGWANHRF